ncbi:MAG: TetR family transcriptional regulator [Clostridia bacterium]|nr:TetR family transcriptional regulator [Clostridia bacterium]
MLNSEYAKQRILDAALDLFGKIGYAATTVRMIATQADVSLSAIPYYFESKENLYLHVVQKATKAFHDYFLKDSAEIQSELSHEPIDPDKAKKLILLLANKHFDFVFNPDNEKQLRLFFQMRSSEDAPHVGGDLLGTTTVRPMVSLLMRIKPSLTENEAIVLAYSIIGEQLFFFYHKPGILEQLGRSAYDKKTCSLIRKTLLSKLTLMLDL